MCSSRVNRNILSLVAWTRIVNWSSQHVCRHVGIYTHTHFLTYIIIYAYIHIHGHIIYTHTYIYNPLHTYMYVVYTYAYIIIYIYTYVICACQRCDTLLCPVPSPELSSLGGCVEDCILLGGKPLFEGWRPSVKLGSLMLWLGVSAESALSQVASNRWRAWLRWLQAPARTTLLP